MTTEHLSKVTYWHRELPPLEADILGEHVVEAVSSRVPGTLTHRDELWTACYRDLMERTGERIQQEVMRLGGDFAHVLGETIDVRHDEAADQAWLHGQFTYTLYRRGAQA